MLRNIEGAVRSDDSGFSLIELLVITVVIGILAAIAIPAFLGNREKAQDSEAKSAVRVAATTAKAYFADKDTFVGMTAASLRKIEPSLGQGQGATLSVRSASAIGYRLRVSSKTSNRFSISERLGVTTRTCTASGKAGCPTGGNW